MASWFPGSLRHRRNELVDSLAWIFQRPALLRALVGGHQHLHDVQAIVKRQPRLLLAKKYASEMSVFIDVAVRRRFLRHDRHQPHLGVLLLDEIFALPSLDLSTEEQLQPGVERIPLHRVLGAEEL